MDHRWIIIIEENIVDYISNIGKKNCTIRKYNLDEVRITKPSRSNSDVILKQLKQQTRGRKEKREMDFLRE